MAPVKAVMPLTGYPINVDGLWQAHARGVSIENLAHSSTNPDIVLDVLMKRINSTQVRNKQKYAAIQEDFIASVVHLFSKFIPISIQQGTRK